MNQGKSSKFVPALPSDDDNSIKIYDGVAECTMNDADTIKNVKIRAKDLAQENLLKKTADYVNGFLKDRFLTFHDEEILSIANEIYKITDVKYDVFNSDDNLMIRATVLAQIDDKDIMNCLVRFFKERTELKSQNESLRKENEDLKRQIDELKHQIDNSNQIAPKVVSRDKTTIAGQKSNEAYKLFLEGNYSGAIKLYSEAIRLNPNAYNSYFYRSRCYHKLGDDKKAQDDYRKAISLGY